MYDSYGKFPPDGLSEGKLWLMGSPDSCLEVNASQPDPGGLHLPFMGKYCFIQPLAVNVNETDEAGAPASLFSGMESARGPGMRVAPPIFGLASGMGSIGTPLGVRKHRGYFLALS